MRIIMSIREKRNVMTNAMALRQSSSHPLMCDSPILHACRPDEMYTRSELIYSIHFQYHPGVFQDAFILILDQICHELFRGKVKLWMHRQTDADNDTLRPDRQRSKVRRMYIILFSKMIVILRMLRSWCIFQLRHIENVEVLMHFSTASDVVSSNAKHSVVLIRCFSQ